MKKIKQGNVPKHDQRLLQVPVQVPWAIDILSSWLNFSLLNSSAVNICVSFLSEIFAWLGKLQWWGKIYCAYLSNKYICVQSLSGEVHRKEPIKIERGM
jgi:hypothetical protein